MAKKLILLLAAGLILRLLLSIQIFHGDVNNHVAWGESSIKEGFGGIYDRDFAARYGREPVNYPPIPVFAFNFFHRLYNGLAQVLPSDEDVLPAFLKIPAMVADLGIAVLVYFFAIRLVGKKNSRWPLVGASLVLFNPAFFYNSAYWGQVEAIPLFFVLGSFYFLLSPRRYILSAALFSLALLSKQTAVVFAPIFALAFVFRFGWWKTIKSLLVSTTVFWLAFLPFYTRGGRLLFPVQTYISKILTGSVSDFATDHAFNFWALVTGLAKISDWTPSLFGLPFWWWGALLTSALLAVILYGIFKKQDAVTLLFAATLLPFATFLFMTRIHERHFEPVLPFLLLLSVRDKKLLWIFVFLSIFHFANLYHNWWAPRIQPAVEMLSQVPVINGLIVLAIGSFLFLFIKYLRWVES